MASYTKEASMSYATTYDLTSANWLVSKDDKYAVFQPIANLKEITTNSVYPFLVLDNDYDATIGWNKDMGTFFGIINKTGTNIFYKSSGNAIYVYEVVTENENTLLKLKTFENIDTSTISISENNIIGLEGNNLIICDYGDWRPFLAADKIKSAVICNIDISNIQSTGTVPRLPIVQKLPVNSFSSTENNSTTPFRVFRSETTGEYILTSDDRNLGEKLIAKIDTGNIIGVKYKGKYFYNIPQGQLSAGQPDVVKGKTFIGYMGTVETGTKEVP